MGGRAVPTGVPTSLLNSLHAEPDEAGHCGVLPLAQGFQAAPEHLVWEKAVLGQTGSGGNGTWGLGPGGEAGNWEMGDCQQGQGGTPGVG